MEDGVVIEERGYSEHVFPSHFALGIDNWYPDGELLSQIDRNSFL